MKRKWDFKTKIDPRMLAKRIIPCLDVDKSRVVKGYQFENLIDAGDPVQQAKFYDKEGADELIFLDITASTDKRKTMIEVASRVADVLTIPFTIGGGIRDIDDIREVLKAGADKVSINTSALYNPGLIRKGAEKFGSQCIVVAIDAKLVKRNWFERKKPGLKPYKWLESHPELMLDENLQDKTWEVYVNGGRTQTGVNAIKWAEYVESLGAGEILLTSMDKDGTKDGYDIDLLKSVTEKVNIPVIASGGAGEPEHMYEAFEKANVDAVLAASIFHFRKYSIREVKRYLKSKGINVRL